MGWNRRQIVGLLREAGDIALRYYDAPAREIKADGTMVTEADRAVEDFLAANLDRPDADSYLIGEETVATKGADYCVRALAHEAFVVDPIDGTMPYAHHIPVWGISVGWMQAGVLSQGAVFFPCSGELFVTDGDDVLLGLAADNWRFEAIPPEHAPYTSTGLIGISQGMARHSIINLPNYVHALACAVVPLVHLTLGRYIGAMTRGKIWDVAGALPMLWKLGYHTQLIDGTPVTPKVDNSWLHLEWDRPEQWYLRHVLVAADADLAPKLCASVENPG